MDVRVAIPQRSQEVQNSQLSVSDTLTETLHSQECEPAQQTFIARDRVQPPLILHSACMGTEAIPHESIYLSLLSLALCYSYSSLSLYIVQSGK